MYGRAGNAIYADDTGATLVLIASGQRRVSFPPKPLLNMAPTAPSGVRPNLGDISRRERRMAV